MRSQEMTREDFERVPARHSWAAEVGDFSAIVVLPARVPLWSRLLYRLKQILRLNPRPETVNGLHDSGYRLLDFVAIDKNDKPICRLSGCSDVVHFDGISGFGWNWLEGYGRCPDAVPPAGWTMDCLPTSGLLRIWCRGNLRVGPALSSLELYCIPRE